MSRARECNATGVATHRRIASYVSAVAGRTAHVSRGRTKCVRGGSRSARRGRAVTCRDSSSRECSTTIFPAVATDPLTYGRRHIARSRMHPRLGSPDCFSDCCTILSSRTSVCVVSEVARVSSRIATPSSATRSSRRRVTRASLMFVPARDSLVQRARRSRVITTAVHHPRRTAAQRVRGRIPARWRAAILRSGKYLATRRGRTWEVGNCEVEARSLSPALNFVPRTTVRSVTLRWIARKR